MNTANHEKYITNKYICEEARKMRATGVKKKESLLLNNSNI
jgi:hypothetical protein